MAGDGAEVVALLGIVILCLGFALQAQVTCERTSVQQCELLKSGIWYVAGGNLILVGLAFALLGTGFILWKRT